MGGFVDLHCHYVPFIDDGARTEDEGLEILRALADLGFTHVAATPHMRPGMFDNDAISIFRAFERFSGWLSNKVVPVELSLGSEHYYCEEVLARAQSREVRPFSRTVLPSPERGSLLVEFHDLVPLATIEQQLFRLQTLGYLVLIAHPERYRALWSAPAKLERLVDLGSYAQLDLAAVVGKYGVEPERCAKKLLELGYYDLASSDSHRVEDVADAGKGLRWLERNYGSEEVDYLLRQTTTSLLAGERPVRAS